jgi:hypothetical protein
MKIFQFPWLDGVFCSGPENDITAEAGIELIYGIYELDRGLMQSMQSRNVMTDAFITVFDIIPIPLVKRGLKVIGR